MNQNLAANTSANSQTTAQVAAQIKHAAEVRLQECGYPAVRRLTCTFHEGILVLHGVLPSYFLKQVAQTLVSGIGGVVEILNRAEVRDGD